MSKKKIEEDWLGAFPLLNKYSQFKFYRIVGPVIIGLELINIPKTKQYRPYFVIFALFGNRLGVDLKSVLSAPIVQIEITDSNGFQIEIEYENHSKLYAKAIRIIKSQLPLIDDETISVQDLTELIRLQGSKFPLAAAPDSYLQASLLRNIYIIELLMIGDANKTLSEIKERDWNREHFNLCKVEKEEWIKSLEEINRDTFMSLVVKNKSEPKLSKFI